MSKIKAIKIDDTTYDIRGQIYFGTTDSTSTATAFTSQISGITEYFDGLTIYLFNNKVATASGITININSLGAKPVYRANANNGLVTTHWAVNTGYLLVYNSSRNSNAGGWDWQTGYDSNSDTTCTGAIRNTYSTYAASGAIYDYMLCFQSSETQVIPANTVDGSTATSKALNTASFIPGGVIGYYNTTTTIASGSAIPAGNFWTGYTLVDLRYSFNSGSTLTANKDVYIQCSVQSDGKLKFSGNSCIKQALPTSADGYVYILLGHAHDTYRIALYAYHPIFIYANSKINLWSGYAAYAASAGSASSASSATTAITAINIASFSLTGDVTGSTTSGHSVATTLAASGVSSGSYGPSAGGTLSNTSSFTVPYVTFDTKGRATAASSKTYTLNIPANTDVSVTQNAAITTSGEYPVILANSTATTAVTGSVNKTSSLKYNPSTGVLSATKFSGDGSALTNLPGGTDVNVTQNAAISTAGEYPLILANSTATTAVTGSVNKTSSLKYNPNTQVLTTPKIAGTTMTGKLICQNNSDYDTKQARNIFIISSSSSLPTGANGDICLLY